MNLKWTHLAALAAILIWSTRKMNQAITNLQDQITASIATQDAATAKILTAVSGSGDLSAEDVAALEAMNTTLKTSTDALAEAVNPVTPTPATF